MTTFAACLAIVSFFALVACLLAWVQSPTVDKIFGERRGAERRKHDADDQFLWRDMRVKQRRKS
jgi:hypothetical protein